MTSDQSDVTKTVMFADPPGTNNFISAEVPVADLNEDMMDVAFTKAVGCTQYLNGGCDGMRKDHRFADAVPLGENWRHKYLIDLDGMGYSARLFSLVCCYLFPLTISSLNLRVLSSRRQSTLSTCRNGSNLGLVHLASAIDTQLHYIPVSQMYNEIYNVYAYFSGPSEAMLAAANSTREQFHASGLSTRKLDGDAELQKIAKAGREWMFTVGRKADMEVYLFRYVFGWSARVC